MTCLPASTPYSFNYVCARLAVAPALLARTGVDLSAESAAVVVPMLARLLAGINLALPQIRLTAPRSVDGAKTPTIVISLLDDQGYADVPWHAQDAATQAAMPFADALRKDGIDVPNYHAWRDCTPSRAMLLTGRHHAQLGMHVPLLGACFEAGGAHASEVFSLLLQVEPHPPFPLASAADAQ